MAISYLCSGEAGDIVIGTLFAWQAKSNAPRVARYRADGGQLLWATVGPKLTERAFAVLIGGQQVLVQSAGEALNSKPARILIEFTKPEAPDGARSIAEIALPALLECVLEENESIEATRVA